MGAVASAGQCVGVAALAVLYWRLAGRRISRAGPDR